MGFFLIQPPESTLQIPGKRQLLQRNKRNIEFDWRGTVAGFEGFNGLDADGGSLLGAG